MISNMRFSLHTHIQATATNEKYYCQGNKTCDSGYAAGKPSSRKS